jgi:hypothetical protein
MNKATSRFSLPAGYSSIAVTCKKQPDACLRVSRVTPPRRAQPRTCSTPWVSLQLVTKTSRFWQKRSPNYDFLFYPLFVLQQPDGWVRREG